MLLVSCFVCLSSLGVELRFCLSWRSASACGGHGIFKLQCCWGGRRVGVGRVEGVLLVCLVYVDRVFAQVDFLVSVSSLFFGFPVWCSPFHLLSIVVDWQLDPVYQHFRFAVHVQL